MNQHETSNHQSFLINHSFSLLKAKKINILSISLLLAGTQSFFSVFNLIEGRKIGQLGRFALEKKAHRKHGDDVEVINTAKTKMDGALKN